MSGKRRDIPFWAKLGHGKPVTRRDFLATGIIPFSAWMVGPSLATILHPLSARADECPSAASSPYAAFITLNLSGGPSLASQLAVKSIEGNYLPSYTKVGLGSGPARSFEVTKEFGNVDFAGRPLTGTGAGTAGALVSHFLLGMKFYNQNTIANAQTANSAMGANANKAAMDNTAFIWSSVALQDDTSMNPLDVTGLVLKMGRSGSKLPNLGRTDTTTGINQKSAILPPPAPFVVGSLTDLKSALDYSAAFKNDRGEVTSGQKTALARVIASLSASQVRRIGEMSGTQAVTKLVECAGIRNVDLIATGGGDVDPYLTTEKQKLIDIWKPGANAVNDRDQDFIFGAMVYNALMGNASTVNLNLGGYDYHDATRTSGNQRDFEAGKVVGKILKTAQAYGKPVFVYVCADGATVSAEGSDPDSAWMSDRGIAGMQYMFAYDPAGRPATSANQIGGFNEGQAADGKFPTSTSGELAAQAVFANYAAWSGQTAFLEQYRILGDAALRGQAIKLQKKG